MCFRREHNHAPPQIYKAESNELRTDQELDEFLKMVALTADDESCREAAVEALALWVQASDARLQHAFFEAVEAGDLALCQSLRSQGASIYAEDAQQLMPLHICAQLGHITLATWLLAEGAELDAGANGQVAMHFACVHGELDFAMFLRSHGGDVSCTSEDTGAQPLHGSCQEGHLSCVAWLISEGAAVDARDDEGALPLHAAAQEGHLEVAKRLRALGAPVDVADIHGRTAMHSACVNGHLCVAQWLRSEGAAVDIEDASGRRPGDYANANGHTHVNDWLKLLGLHT